MEGRNDGLLSRQTAHSVSATWLTLLSVGGIVISRWCPMYAELEQALLSVQELYDSRGGRPGLSVLTSLLVSLDVKLY